VAYTFKSTISLFLASNSFFTGSSASPFLVSGFASAASPSFFASVDSDEYHRDDAILCELGKANFEA
jgi:hypothetical protein